MSFRGAHALGPCESQSRSLHIRGTTVVELEEAGGPGEGPQCYILYREWFGSLRSRFTRGSPRLLASASASLLRSSLTSSVGSVLGMGNGWRATGGRDREAHPQRGTQA